MDELNESCLDAKSEGYDAWFDGVSDTQNPYEIGTDEHMSWNDGYMLAEEENS